MIALFIIALAFVVIAAAVVFAIRFFRYLGEKYGENRATKARVAFKEFDPREPEHIQAWGRQSLGLYRKPNTLVAMRDGKGPFAVDPTMVRGWYVGMVNQGDVRSNYILIYDNRGNLLVHVGYMKQYDGEIVIACLYDILPGKQLNAPGKLPNVI